MGPQAPTAFSNGPTILECQADLVVDTISRLEREGANSIEPISSAAAEWTRLTEATIEGSLMGGTDSWWNAGNIPGKKKQAMVYNAGIANYESTCREKLAQWEGFEICK
ncbi:hypothetical protein IL306_004157 [Fusarium sp. DS 682]|nr:hypothetical protein IL306_004157 [Fusarium sp. DS 682]